MNTSIDAAHNNVPLGEMLIAQGRITRAELDAALSYRQERGIKLGQALVALSLVTQAEVAAALRSQGKVHCIRLTPGIVSKEIAELLGEERARSLQAIAINKIAGVVTVAMEDPSEVYNVDAISVQLDAPILAVYAEPAQIERCIDHVFRCDTATPVAAQRALERTDAPVVQHGAIDPTDVDVECAEPSFADRVRELVREALVMRASDIHVEPRSESLHFRFRVDGVLLRAPGGPASWARPILAHLKSLAGLDANECRLPQSGAAHIEIAGRSIDLRIRTIPALSGEGAVMRLLDATRPRIDLTDLALKEEDRADVERMIDARGGIVLVSGPVGAGKTTTLYAFLQHIHSPQKKIVTIEDPVEIPFEGAAQISINPRIGLTFARGVRSVTHQDADVVLVGEMHDEETAELAVDIAVSGRLVLSTMHTAGAVESITRLLDMGVRPYLVADTLRGVVAQRLVRKICARCRRIARVDPDIAECLELGSAETFFEGAGCEACNGSGYAGRTPVFEVLGMSAELAALVRERAPEKVLRDAARRGGLALLREDGIRKARAGDTTLEEVYAVTARP